jgi:DNA-binding response OmpR family regulator
MRLLIVEDEKKASEFLRKGLTESGFVVDVADDGADAVCQGAVRPCPCDRADRSIVALASATQVKTKA